MKSLVENIIASSDLGTLPALALVIMFLTMIVIIAWTFRPGSANGYEQDAKLTIDEGKLHDQ